MCCLPLTILLYFDSDQQDTPVRYRTFGAKSEISCTSTWYVSRRQLQGLRPSRGARDNPNYCAEISPAQDQEQEQDAASGQGFFAYECSFTTSEGTITITTTTTTASAATAAAATTRRRLVMLRFVPLLLGWANCNSSSGSTWHSARCCCLPGRFAHTFLAHSKACPEGFGFR